MARRRLAGLLRLGLRPCGGSLGGSSLGAGDGPGPGGRHEAVLTALGDRDADALESGQRAHEGGLLAAYGRGGGGGARCLRGGSVPGGGRGAQRLGGGRRGLGRGLLGVLRGGGRGVVLLAALLHQRVDPLVRGRLLQQGAHAVGGDQRAGVLQRATAVDGGDDHVPVRRALHREHPVGLHRGRPRRALGGLSLLCLPARPVPRLRGPCGLLRGGIDGSVGGGELLAHHVHLGPRRVGPGPGVTDVGRARRTAPVAAARVRQRRRDHPRGQHEREQAGPESLEYALASP
ncbi:hypothetical protein G5V59_14800 [Nocardioides sp. W3-2-3]|uniref:hypothetical protein n=1 Tax=Nocardioides convexus TaxID=2712224 RepID=UPI00241889E3|nr:hypothetical protein [Nocardioides convexus]NHA00791.1 hypothetical protein [Nocardioides convexus]